MKKYILLIVIIFLSSFHQSCEQDKSLEPTPTIVFGQYVKIEGTKTFLNFDKINETVFEATLSSPGNNVKSFELYVRLTTGQGVTTGVYKKLPIEINSFPYQLKITPQILAAALNVPLSAFSKGDTFYFLGYSYDNNGKVCDFNSLSAVVKSQAGYKQGYKFITKFFDQSAFDIQSNDEKPYDIYNF